jgi:hypothetical protein
MAQLFKCAITPLVGHRFLRRCRSAHPAFAGRGRLFPETAELEKVRAGIEGVLTRRG